ncbi:NmrA family NAD(P)-binding protein [Bradyrhizobium sp. 164]|uniref:NmrA family NAD(P)-binding protein n=1 Tax=Bradyrhizobium sp. 164 TaxID=2782637 RepID=UPI001FF7BA08
MSGDEVEIGECEQVHRSTSVVQGDLLDVDALRGAFSGVSTLFLLNAVVPDEFTQALIALNVAREAGVERVVYLSVIHSDRYVNVPHFAGKFGVERMIEQMGFNATILRPAYFMNNDVTIKDVVTGYGIYPMPIGSKGLAMIDARDIGEIAAIELIRRERAAASLPLDRINLVGPETLTGAKAAAVWSEVLGRTIAYPGDDTAGFEKNLRQFMPSWMAFDMRLMSERFLTEGMVPEAGDVERLTALLRRPLRSYRDFVSEIAASA